MKKQLITIYLKIQRTSQILASNRWFVTKQLLALFCLGISFPFVIKIVEVYLNHSYFYSEAILSSIEAKIFLVIAHTAISELIIYLFLSEFFLNELYSLKGIWLAFEEINLLVLPISLLLLIDLSL